jgi:hypothetical protein
MTPREGTSGRGEIKRETGKRPNCTRVGARNYAKPGMANLGVATSASLAVRILS